MSSDPYDPEQHQISVLEGIEEQLTRIANALEALASAQPEAQPAEDADGPTG